jgi:hypothetical protein
MTSSSDGQTQPEGEPKPFPFLNPGAHFHVAVGERIAAKTLSVFLTRQEDARRTVVGNGNGKCLND